MIASHPLRVKDSAGELAPVDVTLQHSAAGWAPRNALEPYRIGQTSDAGVAFPGLGVRVRPDRGAASGSAVGQTIFYADSQIDTDMLVKPLTAGVEYAWQLRSVDSPEQLTLRVSLPADASLGAASHAGVKIVQDGRDVGAISAAVAVDADGQLVKTTLQVQGDRIVIGIAHRGQDVAYPILVDPSVDFSAGFYFNYQGTDAMGPPYWGQSNSSGKFHLFGGDYWYGRGLYIQSQNYPYASPYTFNGCGGCEGSSDHAGFYYHAPGNSRIWRVVNSLSRQILGASLQECMLVGITNADMNAWEGDYGVAYGEGCTPFASYGWTVQTNNGAATAGNNFWYGDYSYSTGAWVFDSYFADAEIHMYDDDDPVAGPLDAPAVPPAYITNSDDPLVAHASDASSGIKSITFHGPAGWSGNGQTVTNPACLYGPCSQTFAAAMPIGTMPDGQQDVWFTATDASGKSVDKYHYTLNFDSSPATLTLSGPLWDARESSIPSESDPYLLHVVASDGASGARYIKVYVDNALDYTKSTVPGVDCPDPTGGCSLDYYFNTSRYAAGAHTIRVETNDSVHSEATVMTFSVTATDGPYDTDGDLPTATELMEGEDPPATPGQDVYLPVPDAASGLVSPSVGGAGCQTIEPRVLRYFEYHKGTFGYLADGGVECGVRYVMNCQLELYRGRDTPATDPRVAFDSDSGDMRLCLPTKAKSGDYRRPRKHYVEAYFQITAPNGTHWVREIASPSGPWDCVGLQTPLLSCSKFSDSES